MILTLCRCKRGREGARGGENGHLQVRAPTVRMSSRKLSSTIHSLPPSGTFRPKEESKTPWGRLQMLRTLLKLWHLSSLRLQNPRTSLSSGDNTPFTSGGMSSWFSPSPPGCLWTETVFFLFLSLTFFTLWFPSWSSSAEIQSRSAFIYLMDLIYLNQWIFW